MLAQDVAIQRKAFIFLITCSLLFNLYFAGSNLFKATYIEANEEEQQILEEMIVKVIESEDYKKIAATEEIRAIGTLVDKMKGGVYPYYLTVYVKTDSQTYGFSCTDKTCAKVDNGSWWYSNYKDEEPALPLK